MSENRKRVSRTEDLPDWFQIVNYSGAKDLDAAGWAWELTRRYFSDYTLIGDGWEVPEPDRWEQIFKQPLCEWDYLLDNRRKAWERMYSNHIKRMTVMDFLLAAWNLKNAIPQRNEVLELWEEIDGAEELSVDSRFKDIANTSIDDLLWPDSDPPLVAADQTAHYVVDLWADDELIIADFKESLRQERARSAERHKLRKHGRFQFGNWAHYNVLAYLDLAAWARLSGARITDNCMGEAILSHIDDIDSAQKVRDTVRRNYARYLMDPRTIRALEAQAAADMK